MQLFQILPTVFLIGLITTLIASRKQFVASDVKFSPFSQIFLILAFLVTVGVNGLVLGVAYYKAYHPEFDYDKVSSQVAFHMYQPTFLPIGVNQVSKFYTIDAADFGDGGTAVRAAYDLPLVEVAQGAKSNLIILNQTQVKAKFDIPKYVSTKVSTKVEIKPIKLPNFAGKSAYLQTGGIAKILYVLMPDGVLVSLASVRATEEDLIEMANSLE